MKFTGMVYRRNDVTHTLTTPETPLGRIQRGISIAVDGHPMSDLELLAGDRADHDAVREELKAFSVGQRVVITIEPEPKAG